MHHLAAACLDLGAVASHRSAAALHGLSSFEVDQPVEVVVRHDRSHRRSPLATVHSSTWLPHDDLVEVAGIPTLGVARTLLTLAALVPTIPFEVVRDAVDTAVRDGKATDRWLCWRLEQVRCRGRNGVSIFEQILSERSGAPTESWLERELLRLLAAAGLPLPTCQRRIEHRGAFVARVDFVYGPQRVALEVSGHRHHSTAAQLARDARRRNELQLAGYRVLEFTYRDVVECAAVVVAQVSDALTTERAS
ncbi:MAG TPA: DUF559 domain-containing protein [Aquihabitans sp.]|nr:DUF559 domain-containing protein [Aquihabitans sp.]